MSALSRVLREGGSETIRQLLFYCPGCKMAHAIQIQAPAGPIWSWDGNAEAPTFSPSILVTGQLRCHTFVRAGRIEFLSDCSHELAGKTVDMPDFMWGPGDPPDDSD